MVQTGKGSRFESLSQPIFRRLIISNMFGFIDLQMSLIARGWLAFELTGTNTALGTVFVGFGIAAVIGIPMGGVVADRVNKKTIMLGTGAAQLATTFGLFVAVATDVIEFWMLVASAVVQGAVLSLRGPARAAYIADSVPRELLTNAVLLSQSALQVTRVLGPALAGTLIAIPAIGISGTYFTATVFAGLGFFLSLGLSGGEPAADRAPSSPFDDLKAGFAFVWRNKTILHLLTMSYVIVLMGFPYVAFLPVLAEDVFGAGSEGLGIMTAATAVGAVGTSLRLASVAQTKIDTVQTVAAGLFGLAVVGIGISPNFAVALLIMFVLGGASSSFNALNTSLVLSKAPEEFHGRVQSLLMFSFSGSGLAALPLGALADAVGLRQTFVIMGVTVCVVALVSVAIRRKTASTPAVDV